MGGAANGSSVSVRGRHPPGDSSAGCRLYGVLRLSLALFYEKLGFSPEEVGFVYAQTLAWSLYGVSAMASSW
jgi:hypothetical protein